MDDTSPNRPDRARLVEIASEHAGYFTAEQAKVCGYSRALLSHHAKQGNFVRVRRGLYRLSEFPSTRHEEVMAAWLAAGGSSALVSHESALDLLELSDVIPSSIHITIPRHERWRRAIDGVTFHTIEIPVPREHTQVREGIHITSPGRSIVDSAAAGLSEDQVRAAVASALERGLTTQSELADLAKHQGGQGERVITKSLRDLS